jgi:hypothetical protein
MKCLFYGVEMKKINLIPTKEMFLNSRIEVRKILNELRRGDSYKKCLKNHSSNLVFWKY